MYPQKVTVWCGFWAGGIIGPYFFDHDDSIVIPINGERYRSMITNFCGPNWMIWMWTACGSNRMALCATQVMTQWTLRTSDLRVWLHTQRRRELATEIVRFDPIILFLVRFSWEVFLSRNKPQTTDALKVNISHAIAQIQPDLCARVTESWTSLMRATQRSRGGYLNDVIFHT